ncbi:MAG: 23S rRNA (guanosine(2251)-2'-O)-methyltransferase RlmB [Pseudomonadales bacterium]|nr:23S rRNA (guanosine(2251)-2'-O)-methyltransferase RlmB [Pseudomonadales bacterium]
MSQVAGIHAVAALLADAPERVRALYVQRGRRDQRMSEVISAARAHGIRVEFAERRWLDGRVEGSHQGVLADCHDLALADEHMLEARWPELGRPRLVLVLDGITDPRNLGACLRSANAAGVDAVLLPRRRSAPLNEAALKAAAGGAEGLFLVEVANLARRLEWLKEQGVWVIGADGSAELDWTSADFRQDCAIVVGSEGEGMRALTRKLCDHVVRIPMQGSVASLNVSVATGILLFEVVRQRGAV